MDPPLQSPSISVSHEPPKDDFIITGTLPPPATKRRRAAPSAADCCRTCRLRKATQEMVLAQTVPDLNYRVPSTSPTLLQRLQVSNSSVSRTTPSNSHTEAGTIRKRAQRACSQCHAHKTKCSGDLPRCKRCEAGDLSCEYTPAKRKFTNVHFNSSPYKEGDQLSSRQTSGSSDGGSPLNSNVGDNFVLSIDTSILNAEELLFRKDVMLKHMDAYFEYIYYMPCMGFFRRNKVYQEIQDGTFDPATAAAMCAITSLFVNPCEAGRVFSVKCSDQVELYVFRSIFRFAEEVLILYALNCYHNFLHGHLAKVWQCFGIATRLMIGLQVNWDVQPRDRSFAHQETMRRIVWQFFYLDRLLAGGYDEYIGCRDEIMKIRLPCSEDAFRENRPVVVERLHEKAGKNKDNMGVHGYQLRLIDIRHRILVSARKMGGRGANRSRMEPSKVMATINGFQNELSQINASLPENLKLNYQNIARAIKSEDTTGYVFIHTSLASVHIDLYSLCLPGLREQLSPDLLNKLPREFVTKSQKQAVAHALCLGRFCDTLQRQLDQQPNTGKLKLVGCASMVKVTTQCLRVLLTALQHNLYQDLADHTTASFWSNEPADEPHIRGLIDSLLKISKSWCHIIPRNQQTYERNKAAVEQFYKTRKYADQKALGPVPSPNTIGYTRLPGPQHILETAFVSPVEEDRGNMTSGDAAAADQWFGPALPQTQTSSQPAQEGDYDVEYGPPGIPMFLAEAQGVSPTPTDDIDTFDATDDLLLISNKMMQIPKFSDILTSEGPISLGSDGDKVGIFQPSMHPHASQSPFPPQQHGMFMNGYNVQYENGRREPPSTNQRHYQ
ncbi:hypothetical protein QQX98_003718 [Neonectria punicea]|uniref:Zn(2)-C6 fungal-type domain-containing protein n=1 Tax=Neonectria punicea TaxID=979145 RepID=A0ABR1HCQ6_9HYPO